MLVQKKVGSKKFGVKNNFESNKYWVQKFWVKWSGSENKKSNSFFLTFLYSCIKIELVTIEIFPIWTNVTRIDGSWKLPLKFGQNWDSEMVPGTYLSSLNNIRSVTAEIFLIWTNVPRANVTKTNVTMKV